MGVLGRAPEGAYMAGPISVRGEWTSEQKALHLYALAGADPCEPPGPVDLVEALHGVVLIHHEDEFEAGECAILQVEDDAWELEVHAGLTSDVAAFAIARGLARWYLRRASLPADDDVVEDLAGAILVPEPWLRLAMASATWRPEHLAYVAAVPYAVAHDRLSKCGLRRTVSGEIYRA